MPPRRRLVRLAFSLLLAAIIAVVGVDVAGNPVPTPSATNQEAVTVERVVDGDTIALAGGQKVRLIGIDTPELARGGRPAEPYGEAAKSHLETLIGNQTVRLERDVSERDKYQRLLRYVFLGEINVSIQMVRDGYARSSTYPPDVKYQEEIRAAEREARAARRGLWQ